MDVLRIADLHPAYAAASPTDAVAMANLGAVCWSACRRELQEAMSVEEEQRADVWRAEGRMKALEEFKSRLVAAESLAVRLAAAEGTVAALQGSVEADVAKRVAATLEGFRKDYEIGKMKEIAALREQVAVAEMREELLVSLREKVAQLEAQREALQSQLVEKTAAATKSSHVIGRQGEALVLDLLENTVCKQFPHAEVRDMTTVGHAADFHLWVVGHHGKRVKMLIDSKKYKRAINTEEINKLYSDVDADGEAHCGIMVSIDSAISTKRQFWVSRTPKQKPVLFLTFQDMPAELQRDLICWGVHIMAEFVSVDTEDEHQAVLTQIETFLAAMTAAVRDVDSIIRVQQKSVDDLRRVRGEMLRAVLDFRAGRGEVMEESEDEGEGCVAIVKTTGMRCGRKVVEGDRCSTHRVRVKAAAPVKSDA